MDEPLVAPFGGLLGDTPRLRVIEELGATITTPQTADYFADLCGLSVIEADAILHDLVAAEYALQLETFPTEYVINHMSHRAVAMTFLAYAVLDDAEHTGGAIMDGAVREYLGMIAGVADVD